MFNQKSLLALVATAALVSAGPCDIYATGGTPCVAAHSTTRALYSAFNGSLYQVKRADGTTKDITPISAGGVANSATQDSFCSGSTCVISIIYDQSGKANHLTQAPPGGAAKGPSAGGYDNLASATAAPAYLNGHKVYGVYVASGTGYRNNHATGTATGDAAEGIYAVLDGTHYNGGCCFDYGNAETSSDDTGAGHMEAIYFGNINVWGTGAGSGPWIMADLENGLFSGKNMLLQTSRCHVAHTHHRPGREEQCWGPHHQVPLHHRHREGRVEQLGDPRWQRRQRLAVHVLQRRAPVGLQPHAQGRCDHPRHGRRQQRRRRRHLLRGCHDERLPV
jgi:hypothetical protein